MSQYTEGGYLCPANDRFSAKATEIAAGVESDAEIAKALFRQVRDTYCWDMAKTRGAQYLLEKQPQRAMSFDKSNLLVSLLRSSNIPARFKFIKCIFYNEYKEREDTSIHAPVEARIDGDWTVADPAFGPHTEQFKSVAEFGEETWETIESEKILAALPRWFVLSYNYGMRFVHPTVRQIRDELRECQEL